MQTASRASIGISGISTAEQVMPLRRARWTNAASTFGGTWDHKLPNNPFIQRQLAAAQMI